MNYRDFIAQALALKNPWPAQTNNTDPHPSLTHDPSRVDAERAKLKDLLKFKPTKNSKVNKLIRALQPVIFYDMEADGAPYYDPNTDTIHLPPPAAFNTPGDYIRTLMHELSHWTKAPNRLNRSNLQGFEVFLFGLSPFVRAKEEFTAELTAASVLEKLAPELWDFTSYYAQHYVNSWSINLRKMGMDETSVAALALEASGDAKKAAEYLLSSVGEKA